MLVICVVLMVTVGPSLARDEPVVFSEIMWMGSSGSTADEWVELHNTSDGEIDLSGWVITRLSAGEERTMVEIGGGRIGPRGTFLISNFAPDDNRSRLAADPDLISSAVALANAKLQLRLYAGDPSSGGSLVDVADDGSGAPLAGDPKLKRAMVRIDFNGAGTEAASWATATRSRGWDDDSSELGTPDSIPAYLLDSDRAASTAIRSESWAELKAGLVPLKREPNRSGSDRALQEAP